MASITFGYNYGKAKKAGSFDSDAQAFFTAASITDSTQKNAVNQLVLDLKSYGVWSKCSAIYPIVGGTASSHKYNLKNPLDTDAAFRLSFSTGWTHSSTGMTPNGTSAYANTFLSTSAIGQNSGHYSIYIRTNNTTQAVDIGSYQVLPDSFSYLYTYVSGALRDYRYCDNSAGLVRITGVTSTTGLFLTSRTASNVIKGFRNGSVEGSNSNGTTTTSVLSFFLGAMNNSGTAGAYSNRQQCFASIGSGLTDTESANFYTAVQAYQTTLSRNV